MSILGGMPLSVAEEVCKGLRVQDRVALEYLTAIGQPEWSLLKGPEFAAWDYVVITRSGFPRLFLEVKARRVSLEKYNDAIFPLSKHHWAIAAWDQLGVPLVGVVRWPDALGTVQLRRPPAQQRMIGRRDRQGGAVPHGVWTEVDILSREPLLR